MYPQVLFPLKINPRFGTFSSIGTWQFWDDVHERVCAVSYNFSISGMAWG